MRGCERVLVLAVDAPTIRATDILPLMTHEGPGAAFEGLHLPMVVDLARLPPEAQPIVFDLIRRALRWDGGVDAELVNYLRERRGVGLPWRGMPTDLRWALRVLGFEPESDPEEDDVRRRFRSLLREVHPDHGAESEGAGQRILELTEARRILLA